MGELLVLCCVDSEVLRAWFCSNEQVANMNESHLSFEYMDGSLQPAQDLPGSKGDLVIYSADGVAVFYLFRRGLGMHLKKDDDSHQDQIIGKSNVCGHPSSHESVLTYQFSQNIWNWP